MQELETISTESKQETGKQRTFPTLVWAAAILFGLNLTVALFFYFSPTVFAKTTSSESVPNAAIAKASPFEEIVKDTRWRPRAAEKLRPVLEQVQPVDQSDAAAPAASSDASAAYTSSLSPSNERPASSTTTAAATNTDGRSVTAYAAYHAGSDSQ